MSSETGVRRISPVNSQEVFLASIPEVPSNTCKDNRRTKKKRGERSQYCASQSNTLQHCLSAWERDQPRGRKARQNKEVIFDLFMVWKERITGRIWLRQMSFNKILLCCNETLPCLTVPEPQPWSHWLPEPARFFLCHQGESGGRSPRTWETGGEKRWKALKSRRTATKLCLTIKEKAAFCLYTAPVTCFQE